MDLSPWITPFEKVTVDYYGYARKAAAEGRRVAGYMCSYAPQELLYAAGYLPMRILGRIGETTRADELLQAFSCSFARSVLDSALEGEWPFLSLVLFSHTCDTMQNVADLWRAHTPDTEVLIVSVPSRTDSEAAVRYYTAELERVRNALEKQCGPIPDEKINEALALYREHREAMRELYGLHAANPGLLTGAQMMHVNLAAFLMDQAEHLEGVRNLIAAFNAVGTPKSDGRPRVFVAGSMCRHTAFIEFMESAGCRVVGDDLCVGSRPYAFMDVDGNRPLEAIARSYLARTPCPAFHHSTRQPGDALVEAVRRDKAQGVIFLLTSFCDPAAFDHVPVTQALEKAGIPALTLSVEQHREPPEQMRTRVAAFVEMLQGSATP